MRFVNWFMVSEFPQGLKLWILVASLIRAGVFVLALIQRMLNALLLYFIGVPTLDKYMKRALSGPFLV